MRKSIKWIFVFLLIVIIIGMVAKLLDYNSLSSKNTRLLDKVLTEDIKPKDHNNTGNVKDLITIDYDNVYVFGPYEPIEEMEKQMGFKYIKLKQASSEGWMNIVFVKESKVVAYLYGFDLYYIDIPKGVYSKDEINHMTYYVEERELGNSSGTPKKYMYYEFKDGSIEN